MTHKENCFCIIRPTVMCDRNYLWNMLISYDVRIRKIMRSARNRRGYGWVYDSIQVHINSLLLNHSIENKQGGFVNALISARTSGAYSQLGKQSTHFKINSKVGMSTTVTSSYRGSNMIELYTCSKTKPKTTRNSPYTRLQCDYSLWHKPWKV